MHSHPPKKTENKQTKKHNATHREKKKQKPKHRMNYSSFCSDQQYELPGRNNNEMYLYAFIFEFKKRFQYFSLDNVYEILKCLMSSFNHSKWHALTNQTNPDENTV